jgi:hypothetical protein
MPDTFRQLLFRQTPFYPILQAEIEEYYSRMATRQITCPRITTYL